MRYCQISQLGHYICWVFHPRLLTYLEDCGILNVYGLTFYQAPQQKLFNSLLQRSNSLTARVKPWVMESFLTFDSMDRTPKCDHLLESC